MVCEMNKEVINSPIVNTMQQPLQEITIQRVYAIFSLVLFHTLCIFTSESWGGKNRYVFALFGNNNMVNTRG